MFIARLKRFFIGEPLTADKISEEKIPKWKALAVLSSDALSSVAYATEEILIPLAAFSVAATVYSVPVAFAIAALLVIVAASYRQTISAYFNGGGAYVVAKENLGQTAGLTAAGALLIGYVLTVAVSVAAGVSQITSAFPSLEAFRIPIALFVIFTLTVLNLRGVRESATVFAYPTYVFLFVYFSMIIFGTAKVISGDMPEPEPMHVEPVMAAVPIFLILRAFSSGCAALTGIEAISNAVPCFRHPASSNANITLSWMAGLMVVLFVGITWLSHSFGILPKADEVAVSQLARHVFGTNWFYYLIQISTALILVLAANTSYSGFPWLAAILGKDRFLPRQMAALGDKLVFSNSIVGLSAFAFLLVLTFDGDPHSLIPLYAVGVFLGFTLSQAGMLRHHLKYKKQNWQRGFAINLLGAVTTFVVIFVVGITKFTEGAWIVIILIPLHVLIFKKIHAHYLAVGKELTLFGQVAPEHLSAMKHTVIVPISGIHRGVIAALRYALSISDDVRACYVEINPDMTEKMKKSWEEWGHDIPFVVLKSPYRSVITPLLEYIEDIGRSSHGELLTVVIPEFVTTKWWHRFLHNQTAFIIRAALLFKKNKVVTSVRYHLHHV